MTGSTPAVFIPGLAGHAAEFDAVADGWTDGPTLRLDPFYGEPSIAGQAARVAAAAQRAGFARYLVVGHSQGGLVALELAKAGPDSIAAVGIVDAPILVPAPVRAAMTAFAALLRTPLGPALLRAFFRATFAEADGHGHRADVMARLAAIPHADARRLVRATFRYPAREAIADLTVPAAYIRANIPTPLDRLPAGVRGYDLSGAGHWVHLHHPQQVTTALRELVTATGSAAAGIPTATPSCRRT
ncbi:alpha/beta fold hydrolase [Nocardia sp. NPDC057353]|uniref:alpha/beta fold hydrolase n=1 Tax=Nocardia sp. NPDC057353 TaxID=3346104 RepID=UPI0036363107